MCVVQAPDGWHRNGCHPRKVGQLASYAPRLVLHTFSRPFGSTFPGVHARTHGTLFPLRARRCMFNCLKVHTLPHPPSPPSRTRYRGACPDAHCWPAAIRLTAVESDAD